MKNVCLTCNVRDLSRLVSGFVFIILRKLCFDRDVNCAVGTAEHRDQECVHSNPSEGQKMF